MVQSKMINGRGCYQVFQALGQKKFNNGFPFNTKQETVCPYLSTFQVELEVTKTLYNFKGANIDSVLDSHGILLYKKL